MKPLSWCATVGALVSSLTACQTPALVDPADAAVEVEYVGETENAAVPSPEDVRPDPDWVEDAGAFSPELRCCQVVFAIPAEEPTDATGVVTGSAEGLSTGVPLVRTDAGWFGSSCLPLNSVIRYRYQFTFASDGGDSDAGAFITIARASPWQLTAPDGEGAVCNIYNVAEDCSAADAGLGMRP